MKLLFHEKILGAITLLFVVFTLASSLTHEQRLNVVAGSEQSAVPYLININTAGIAELDTLDGIGEKTAEAIIKYRDTHGEFKTKDELCEVSGIGTATLEKIKDYIKV